MGVQMGARPCCLDSLGISLRLTAPVFCCIRISRAALLIARGLFSYHPEINDLAHAASLAVKRVQGNSAKGVALSC